MNARRAYLHDRTTASAGERWPVPPPEPKVVGSNPPWRIELPRGANGGDNAPNARSRAWLAVARGSNGKACYALAAAATAAGLRGLRAPYTHTPLVDGPQMGNASPDSGASIRGR